MLFSSMAFIFVFLPLICALCLVSKKGYHNFILLLASILFYAWGEPTYVLIMLLTILSNYLGALGISRYKSSKRLILGLTILANLGVLFYFKYFTFVIQNINTLFSSKFDFIDVVMPIGISFYTFQAMSYLLDVYREDVHVQKNIYKLALYISLFPQLVAGPIVKYHDVADQIDSREINLNKVALGVKRFIIGLSKKMLLANTFGAVADQIFSLSATDQGVLTLWLGAICYSFQLFYDFSGYSDMAIGLGLIFGFRFMENFNYPYISKSITEFWRRWHISLSTWFREYLYIPLGGNRVSASRVYLNLFIVFLATGIWHGANWTFIVWGLWHGAFIIFEKLTGWHKDKNKLGLRFIQHIYTLLIAILGWVIFRSDTMEYAGQYIAQMFNFINAPLMGNTMEHMDNILIITLLFGVLCATPCFAKILQLRQEQSIQRGLVNTWLLIIFFLSVMTIASSTYNPFIYFRF